MLVEELIEELQQQNPKAVVGTAFLGISHAISGIDRVISGTYPNPSWEKKPGKKIKVVVLDLEETTLNENEDCDLDLPEVT